jgi:hypothetical protein
VTAKIALRFLFFLRDNDRHAIKKLDFKPIQNTTFPI